jgi:thioredoxin reductase (NADPH)/alkyl hydroperoxide reductase subunit F
MASNAARDSSTDLIIVGGGPAGCAAALMAASVGMRSVLIEADALCAKLQHIAAVTNVVGGHTSGPELAAAIANDVTRTGLCRVELGVRATEINAFDDHVTVTLDSGPRLTAPYAVVATGVGPLAVEDASWLTAPDGVALPTLWGVKAPETGHGPGSLEPSRAGPTRRGSHLALRSLFPQFLQAAPAGEMHVLTPPVDIAPRLRLQRRGRLGEGPAVRDLNPAVGGNDGFVRALASRLVVLQFVSGARQAGFDDEHQGSGPACSRRIGRGFLVFEELASQDIVRGVDQGFTVTLQVGEHFVVDLDGPHGLGHATPPH